MKVDTSRLKKGTSEVPTECQTLIDKLRSCSMDELLEELRKIDTWTFGKSELYHWIDVLDIFDGILEEATKQIGNDWFLACDERFSPKKIQLLLAVLNFTTLLIEHSFSRHLYNSVEHLTQLLSSTNMEIVLGVLNLLYMFSKRSNFIPRLNCAKRNALLARLTYIAESWGGKEHGYGLAECCHRSMKITDSFPKFYYEYYDSDGKLKSIEQDEFSDFIGITNPSEIAYLMCCRIPIPLDDDQKMLIFTRVRLSLAFHDYETRLQFVLARLQALSVLVYSNSLQDNINTLLYPGFLEELVELLEMREAKLVEIRAAALRTLTSIIHLDRNPNFPKKSGSRLMMIIDVTGASSYHGFLPTLVRTCIQHLTTTPNSSSSDVTNQQMQSTNSASQQQFPLALATALFSFLYHLASYDSGGEALVACGMMESLLRVINWPGKELEHITFVTRAVRVIDLITNIEMQSFQNHGGLQSFIGRLEMEVNLCREEQPSELIPSNLDRAHDNNFIASEDVTMYESNSPAPATSTVPTTTSTSSSTSSSSSSATASANPSSGSSSSSTSSNTTVPVNSGNASTNQSKNSTRSCLPQRAALLKSMLNFLKKAIQDAAFSESIRHVMESSLPTSLRHIISNAEYYGPSLFLLATDVVTVYVFQEPSLLYSLQDSGLTDVVLQALLKKDVPPTREVLGSLPNVFSALCLNSRGLQAFVQYKPFDRLFEVLLSPVYLQAMRRRRSSDPIGDTAANLGNAMDELMRHQPSLKTEATKAIIRLLEELVKLGTDEKYICWRSQNNKCDDSNNGSNNNMSSGNNTGASSSGSGRPSIHVRVLHVNNAINRGVNSSVNLNHDPVDTVRNNIGASTNSNVETGSEDDDEDEESTSSHHNQRDVAAGMSCSRSGSQDNSNGLQSNGAPMKIPLIDYILNVMKFVDAILSNNSTDDHCREFVAQGGLQPLLRILSLPNLPVDSPITASAQAVAAVCKSILSLAHEPQVLKVSLEQLAAVVDQLEPLQSHWEQSQGSVLLRELANCKNIESAFSNATETPLLHAMSAVHGYVVMLVHVCRTGQTEIRNLLIEQWGQNNKYGQKLLYKLVQLYTALVWESTLLLALCTDDIIPVGCDFGKEDLDKLGEPPVAPGQTGAGSTVPMPSEVSLDTPIPTTSSSPATSTLNTTQSSAAAASINDLTMDIDRVLNSTLDGDGSSTSTDATSVASKFEATFNSTATTSSSNKQTTAATTTATTSIQRRIVATPSQLRYIKSLLGASSRLGRALAELFGLLVKLCVGNRMRRIHPQNVGNYMSSASRDIARVLSYILVDGLSHDQLPPSPIPKLKQTFLICSIGFTSPMLFDEKRYAYHLMLHKFCEEGGLQAFFEMFGFALSLEPDTNTTAAATAVAGTSNGKLTISNETGETNEPNESQQQQQPQQQQQDSQQTDAPTPTTDAEKSVAEQMQSTTSINVRTADDLIIPKEMFTNNEDHGEFSAGSGEFLDAWLMLLEKMVNPKTVLESQHVIQTKSLRNKPEFDTVAYLINVHKLAFQTVTKIWSFKPIRTYGARMTESMLTIMKHIYQGEPILREKYNKKIAEQSTSSTNDKTTIKFGSLFPRSGNQPESDTPNRLSSRGIRSSTAAAAAAAAASGVANINNTINEAFLTQLMEMGFSQEHCREALYHTGSMEQATEYLLARTSSAAMNNTTNENPTGMGLDSDDDENIDAEMMVLMGQKVTGDNTTTASIDAKTAESSSTAGTSTFSKRNRRGMRSTVTVLPNQPPLSEQLLSDFGEEAVRTSLYLIDQVPDAVFKGTELLGILFKRTEIKWKMLATIISTMIDCAEQLRTMLTDRVTPLETIFFGEIGSRFTVRLHIFCLFLEVSQYHDLRTPVILSIKEFKLMPKLISLLNETEDVLTAKAGKCLYTPKWLSQMILLIDLYEKVVVSIRRRNEMHRITTNTWKWYDVQSGKWNAYTNGNNKIINDAYNNGETTVRVSVGRHRYTINFNCMSQVNEETGNHRPVVLGLLSSVNSQRIPDHVSATLSHILGSDNEENPNVNNDKSFKTKLGLLMKRAPILTETPASETQTQSSSSSSTTTTASPHNHGPLDRATTAALCEMRENHLKNAFRTYYTLSMVNNPKKDTNGQVTEDDAKLLGLEEFSTENIVATCVRLMSPKICVDRDSLHALMMLCVRLTTKYENAEVFAREGGIKLLLEMKQSGGYLRASTLANLLIRHTLEEPRTLAMAMEKVIAARTLQTIPPGYRDLIFMLRRMSSAVARDPEIFKEIARSMLRIDINTLRRGVFSEDNRLIMKSVAPPSAKRQTEKPNENSIAVKVVYDLLQALIVPVNSAQKQTFEEKVVTNAAKNHSRHTNTSTSFSTSTNNVASNSTFGGNNNNSNYSVEDNDLSFIAMSFGGPNNDTHSSHSSRLGTMHLMGGNEPSTSTSTTSSSNKQPNSLLNDGWNGANSKGENDKPLLSKLTILKALAEAVRSYSSVGVIIAEYTYQPQPNTLIRKAQPALAFILDNLLPSTEQNPDRECSSGARMLIAALSAATDSQITQYTVVTEVRAAILRALSWPEIPEKHAQLQLLTALIPTMIENCPPDQNPALMRLQQHQPRRNDIFNIMVRKGLIADLANITQSLDLSSPHTIVTIGTALKSLEQLLRMSNQSASPVPVQFNKNRSADGDASANNQQNMQLDENQGETLNDAAVFDENVVNENSADDEQVNDNEDGTIEDDSANANEVQSAIAAENDEIEQVGPIESPTNTNEPEPQDFMENPRVDVQPIDSSMLEEIRRRILDRETILDDSVSELSRTVADQARRAVATSVVAAGNATNNASGIQPIELAEERFILEEDDTSSDSDSNGSEENDEEREEESNGEDENEDEAEDRSDLEVDEETRQYIEMYDVYGRHLSPSIPELERDNEDILMIQYADNGRDGGGNNAGGANSVGVSVNVNVDVDNDQPSSSNSNVPSTSGINRTNFPNIFESNNMNRHEEGVSGNGDGSNESATGSQSTSNVIGRIHITTSNSRSGGFGPGSNQPNSLSQLIQFRTQRNANRQRRCAYLNLNGRNSNPPAILQRLLGPVAQNVNIGLGQVIANANGSASFRDATRVVVMDNGFGILSNSGEPSIDLVDQAGYLFGRSLAATLNQTPSPLHWWLEEAKALGIESQADVCLTVCNELIPELEAQRSMELSKTRSKRKKKSPGDTNTKQTPGQKQKSSTTNQSTNNTEVVSALADVVAAAQSEAPSHDNEAEENQQNSEVHSGSEVDDESDDDDSSKNDDELDIENQNLAEDRVIADDDDDDSDDNEDEDDDEDEDDVIQLPLRSYVESNEEMTESDCNVQEDDERTGGGSASDSGRSIASSVSTEPFFSGQSVLTETQPASESAAQTPTPTQSQPATENETNASANNNEQGTTANAMEASTSQVPEVQPDDTNESQDTTELKEQESTSNDDNADNHDIINIYSSGDEDGTENADRKRQRLNSEQDEGQSTSNDNETENREDVEQGWAPRRRLRGPRGTRTPLTESEPSPDESNEPAAEVNDEQSEGATVAPVESVATEDASNVTGNVAASEIGEGSSSGAQIDGTQIPDGIDPSFLAALPEEMRAEVIAEHLRIQRMQERTRLQQQVAVQNEQQAVAEVNPEFLAALPPSIQEEVLAQQRLEQQRLAAAAANPNDPVDAAAFFQNLQPSLRQAILTDMEESQISVLPPDLAAEAQNLRRDWESRNRQIMQEQISQIGAGGNSGNVGTSPSFSSVLRYRSRLPEPISSVNYLQRMRWNNWPINPGSATISVDRDAFGPGSSLLCMEQQGQPQLDHESLTSLLILLFVEANKICTLRFHRVIRILCSHLPTRDWIIRTILSIIERSNQQSRLNEQLQTVSNRPHWLNIRLDAALGNRNNIFIIKKLRHSKDEAMQIDDVNELSSNEYSIAIHPQAAQIVCRHALELLISLAKNFPSNFLPIKKKGRNNKNETNIDESQPSTSSSSRAQKDSTSTDKSTDFWDILLRLEMRARNSKSFNIRETSTSPARAEDFVDMEMNSFSESPFGQLISMLSFNIILKSTLLTDRLLKLLSYISVGLPIQMASTISAVPNGLEAPESNNDATGTEANANANASAANATATTSAAEVTATGTTTTTTAAASIAPITAATSAAAPAAAPAAATAATSAAASATPAAAAAAATETTTPSTSSGAGHQCVNRLKSSPVELDEKCLPESQDSLRLAIEVLTSKSCSEEGLEDATSLLLNLSQCSNVTRTFILNLLIDGAKYLAGVVQGQINDLIYDLRQLNQRNRAESGLSPSNSQQMPIQENTNDLQQPSTSKAASASNTKGILQDRFTKETVVITSTSKQKARCELQLPSMVPLISKTASQSFFLRILKVVIQIRESAKDALAKESNQGAKKIVLNSIELQPLSETLQLDHLWNTLSDCLVELEENADHHAVLVLQPAVEAFFLVHASSQQQAPQSNTEQKKFQSRAQNVAENQGQSADNATETNSTSNVAENNEPMQVSDSPAAAAAAAAADDDSAGAVAEASGTTDTERREMVSPISLFDMPNTNSFPQSNSGDQSQSANDQETSNSILTRLGNPTQQQAPKVQLTSDQKKFLQFAEKHRTVLNQILRQSTVHLSDGPFAVLVDHTRILDFDVKRRYFRTELERMDEGIRREELAVHVHRVTVFEDSFRELYRRNPEEWKNRFYIVFEDEEGQDAGGLLREWYVIISREIFNPMYALFTVSPGDRVTYMINPSSHANSNHLFYFKFVGRVIAKAIYDNKLLECYFTRSFYKHILGIEVNTQDMENEDYEFYKGLVYLMENHVSALGYEQTFSLEVQEFGVTEVRDLIPNGRNIIVTEENKFNYIHLVCQLKMSGSIKQQLNAFLEGFYDIIPKRLISIFNEQELELLISGLPNVDIEDLKANTEYHKYQANSIQIQWFWRALRSFDQADRAKFLQFVTGTSKVPLQGFGALEGMNGVQKFQIHRDDRSTERLPSAHTCFNQLDLPVYKTYDKLRSSLLKAIHECSEGFGFA